MNTSERFILVGQLLLLLTIIEQNDDRLTYIPIDLQKEDFLEMMIKLNMVKRVIESGVISYQYIKPSETQFTIKDE
jgi:hypothetical protein